MDSIDNIGANKLTAILGRTEPKDFVDLYFILRAGYDFDDLLTKAQTKDLGLHPFYLAGSLRQVRNFRRLPATTPPLTLNELQQFILALADRLLDQAAPQ
ncbi:MAG: nucleotidyl transferase AbiEii/AbiGii toxin family protein [Anaerolinea sp.]|nr:nucleotidyl transferase AbiEii/AbiGii toxin family protein [Anaerolinea sp.]